MDIYSLVIFVFILLLIPQLVFIAKQLLIMKRIGYIENTQPILNEPSSVDGLKLSFNSRSISNLHYSMIEISNIGVRTITNADYVEGYLLQITTTGEFLVCDNENEFLVSKSPEISFSMESVDKTRILVYAKFLRREEYIYLNIIHTGTLSIEGKIANGRIVKVDEDSFSMYYFTKVSFCFFIAPILPIIICSNIIPQSVIYLGSLYFVYFAAMLVYCRKKYKSFYNASTHNVVIK